jgi:hypothetical protein
MVDRAPATQSPTERLAAIGLDYADLSQHGAGSIDRLLQSDCLTDEEKATICADRAAFERENTAPFLFKIFLPGQLNDADVRGADLSGHYVVTSDVVQNGWGTERLGRLDSSLPTEEYLAAEARMLAALRTADFARQPTVDELADPNALPAPQERSVLAEVAPKTLGQILFERIEKITELEARAQTARDDNDLQAAERLIKLNSDKIFDHIAGMMWDSSTRFSSNAREDAAIKSYLQRISDVASKDACAEEHRDFRSLSYLNLSCDWKRPDGRDLAEGELQRMRPEEQRDLRATLEERKANSTFLSGMQERLAGDPLATISTTEADSLRNIVSAHQRSIDAWINERQASVIAFMHRTFGGGTIDDEALLGKIQRAGEEYNTRCALYEVANRFDGVSPVPVSPVAGRLLTAAWMMYRLLYKHV